MTDQLQSPLTPVPFDAAPTDRPVCPVCGNWDIDCICGETALYRGQIVTDARTGQSGIIVSSEFREFSGQFVYRVHVAGQPCLQSWGEARLTASSSITAFSIGDMIIADGENGERAMGAVIGFHGGKLIAHLGDGDYLVAVSRVWRAWPMALVAIRPTAQRWAVAS